MISTRLALFFVVPTLFFFLTVPTLARSPGTVDTSVDISADSSEAVVRYQSRVLRGPDPGPSVTVYADGRVRVHRPAYFLDAGEYELRLPADELRNLADELLALGLAEIDTTAIRAEQATRARARLASRGSVETRVGAATSVFELRLDDGASGSPGSPPRRVERRLLWRGLAHDARSFPEIQALVDLAAAEERLREYFDDPRLVPVEEDEP